jgi:4-nitrophenol 2-monooxygenase / 4-nitrocatechol 4-monooxygenase, reductase component
MELGTAAVAACDSERYRHVIGHFATGVTVITSHHGGTDFGATASAVTSLSLEPPSLLVCLNRSTSTEAAIRESGSFVVNILGAEQGELARRFARKSPDKFAGLQVDRSATGDPALPGTLSRIDCRVRDVVAGGTHSVFVGEVAFAEAVQGDPLAYYRGQFGRLAPAGPDLSELCEEVFTARSSIELGVVQHTVGRVADADLRRLRELMETTQGLIEDEHFTDVAQWAQANAAFHDFHVGLAGSAPLSDAYRRLDLAGLILRTYTRTTHADPELADDHRRLVEAYEDGDIDAARRAVLDHADRTTKSQRAAIKRKEEERT